MPKLLSKEASPADLTLNLEIHFKAPASPMTAVYFPAGFPATQQLDVVLYLHGHGAARIDHYLADKRFTLREEVNDAEKWMILVAPSLGSKSESGDLAPNGLDQFLDDVLDGISEHAPEMVNQGTPTVRNLYLASHSGGGEPMRKLAWNAGSSGEFGGKIRECWGFDCLYHPITTARRRDAPDDVGYETEDNWFQWALLNPQCKLYIHYTNVGGTNIRSQNLDHFAHDDPRMNFNFGFGDIYTGNIFVSQSAVQVHDSVPQYYIKERINHSRVVG
jgi:hypothetical protein